MSTAAKPLTPPPEMSSDITKETVARIARREARKEFESQLAEINGEEQKSLADLISSGVNSSADEAEADATEGEDRDTDPSEVEQMAKRVMLAGDANYQHQHDTSNRETIQERYYIDPADYDPDEIDDLREDVSAARERKRSAGVGGAQ